jgi:hypothetical protein
LSYPNAAPGTYKLKITSSDLAATPTLTETHSNAAYADLTLTLKNPNGSTVTSARSTTGSLTLPDSNLSAAGTYTAQITNNSVDVNVPSYSLTVTVPRGGAAASITLELKNAGGTVVATAPAGKPAVLSAAVTAGSYTLVATPTSGTGNATLDATYPGAAGTPTTLTYDQANRLTAYGGTATYAYNGDGTRMSKTVSGATSAFTWDTAGNLIVDGTTNYVYGPDGLPLEQITAGGTVTYYHHDAGRSTRALTNASGTMPPVATYTYDSYGKLIASTGTISNPFRYRGGYTDNETGFIFTADGYYDPLTGTTVGTGGARINAGYPNRKCGPANDGQWVIGPKGDIWECKPNQLGGGWDNIGNMSTSNRSTPAGYPRRKCGPANDGQWVIGPKGDIWECKPNQLGGGWDNIGNMSASNTDRPAAAPGRTSDKFGDCLAGGGWVASDVLDGIWHHFCHGGDNDGDDWSGGVIFF